MSLKGNVCVWGMHALQACCLEVSWVAGIQREYNFNKQEETYPGERTKL